MLLCSVVELSDIGCLAFYSKPSTKALAANKISKRLNMSQTKPQPNKHYTTSLQWADNVPDNEGNARESPTRLLEIRSSPNWHTLQISPAHAGNAHDVIYVYARGFHSNVWRQNVHRLLYVCLFAGTLIVSEKLLLKQSAEHDACVNSVFCSGYFACVLKL